MRARHQPHVLVVEDDAKTARIIALYLEGEGFRVSSATDGAAGLHLAREQSPDLIILDLMLPQLPGLELCRRLRGESETPVIMLTARSTEDDKIVGLSAGADDYITKPFSPRELVARVRAVLRRETADGPRRRRHFRFEGFELDTGARTLTVEGREIRLTPTEFAILETLCRDAGAAVSRQRLIESAFGVEFDGSERTIDAHVVNLRKKIEHSARRRLIDTVTGIGYRFAGRPKNE
jgi:DNA-binding response OmpR family regulator